MARIRCIKPEFPQSESMGRVSRDARLLFIELWTICDDEGRTRAASRMLASLLFPYDSDAPKLMDRWIGELAREGCVVRYEHEGNTYLQVCNWLSHQKIDKPSKSKIPAFANPREDSTNPRERSSEDLRIKEGIKEGEGKGSASPEAPQEASPTAVLIPTNTGEDFPITEAHVAEFEAAYPAVNILACLREMRAWSIANPKNRKTESGMLRFANAWLARAQNKSGDARAGPAPDKGMAGVNVLEDMKREYGLAARGNPDGAAKAPVLALAKCSGE